MAPLGTGNHRVTTLFSFYQSVSYICWTPEFHQLLILKSLEASNLKYNHYLNCWVCGNTSSPAAASAFGLLRSAKGRHRAAVSKDSRSDLRDLRCSWFFLMIFVFITIVEKAQGSFHSMLQPIFTSSPKGLLLRELELRRRAVLARKHLIWSELRKISKAHTASGSLSSPVILPKLRADVACWKCFAAVLRVFGPFLMASLFAPILFATFCVLLLAIFLYLSFLHLVSGTPRLTASTNTSGNESSKCQLKRKRINGHTVHRNHPLRFSSINQKWSTELNHWTTRVHQPFSHLLLFLLFHDRFAFSALRRLSGSNRPRSGHQKWAKILPEDRG